jgi:hypothetical protein
MAILTLLSVEFFLSSTPPIARDALIHHLAIPKLWLQEGAFYEIKWADFSYFPMNVDLLYIIPLYFNKDFLANFIHLGFGIGTALLIYYYLKNRIGKTAGLLGILIFLSTPIVVRLSTQAYVDLGLVFFITAGIFSFIRYGDGEFKEFKWLLLSSITMGLALGTKYNALIAWFFISLAIVFIYSRNTNNQWKAIVNGAIFFIISLLIFSPWLIKNAFLTGNPLYPLFKNIFAISIGSMGGNDSVSGNTSIGFFTIREILYGENFWETMMIPLRIFFQGQDNSIRYFDGVLNPVLIIFSPWAFMNKSFYRDKLLFACFAIFFTLTVFFLEQKAFYMEQMTRYILPVIPFLSILTVMGLINMINWIMKLPVRYRKLYVAVVLCIFIGIMGKNAIYIKNYYHNFGPTNYILGKESRDEFITRHNSSYQAIKYINTNTPENARIRLIFLAGRGYYLDRTYDEGDSYGIGDVKGLAANAREDKSFQKYLHSLGCTHILVRMDLFIKFLNDNYSMETKDHLFRQMKKSTEMIYNDSGYAVFKLIIPN